MELVQPELLTLNRLRREYLLQTARIVNGSFQGVTADECRRGTCGRVGDPAGMRNFRGLAAR